MLAGQVSHAGGRVAGRVQGAHFQRPHAEQLAVFKQVVEVGAIGVHVFGVEDLLENSLHLANVFADGRFPTQLRLQVRRRRQVVRVRMGFQQPGHLEILLPHIGHHLVGAGVRSAARFRVVVQHAVDDGGLPALRIGQHISHREGGGIKKGLNGDAGHADWAFIQKSEAPVSQRVCRLPPRRQSHRQSSAHSRNPCPARRKRPARRGRWFCSTARC